MGSIATAEILDFLQRLGERYPHSARLFLLGGSALCLLGNPRRTLDIDYLAESPPDKAAELQATIDSLAAEMKLELEAVPFYEFVPHTTITAAEFIINLPIEEKPGIVVL